MNVVEINVLVLAYLGDTIYENYVRRYLINKGISNVNDLQKEAVNYVSASNQAKYLTEMLESNFLSDDEIDVVSIPLRFFGSKEGEHGLNYKFKSERVVDLVRSPQNPQLSMSSSFIT